MVAGPYLAGALLALLLASVSAFLKLDAARGYAPLLLVVIASYYELFALMGGSPGALLAESLGLGAFALMALIGFRTSLWVVVAALATHGVFDAFHGRVIDNQGTPEWWPPFCMAFDLVAAASLAWRSAFQTTAVGKVDPAAGLRTPFTGGEAVTNNTRVKKVS